jgi:hypothetical protein
MGIEGMRKFIEYKEWRKEGEEGEDVSNSKWI